MKNLTRNYDLIVLSLLALFTTAILFAEQAAPGTVVASNPASSLVDKITAAILSWQGLTATVAIVLETFFRLIPTQTPLSWAWVASGLLHSLGKLFEVAGEYLDKVLPQRTK